MAASKRHRKLLENLTATATATTAIDDNYCITQCNPQLNPIGLCVSTCNFICPSICRIIDLSSSPPPSSSSSFSPATSPYSSSSSSPMTKSHHHRPPLSLPLRISLIFLFVTFSLFFLYTLCKFYTIWYRSRRRRSPPPSPENYETNDTEFVDHPIWYIRTTGLQSSVINAIAVVKFSKNGGFQSDCSVCLSEFETDETVRLLPNCNHAFHVFCIDTWLRSHTNCPLCRAGIVNNNAVDDSPSPEVNADEAVVIGEIDLGISILGDDNRGESSELRIGERDEEDLNKSEVLIHEGNSELLMIRRSVSVDELEGSDIQSVDGDLGVELTKIGQTTDNSDSMREGK